MQGRIIKIISNQYTVLTEENQFVLCVAMGKVRLQMQPVVGDFVEIEKLEGQTGIQKVLPRINQMNRPLIANVDQALIVMSAVEPEFSAQLVDRLIFLVCHSQIRPILVVTKMDLVKDKSLILEQIEDYRRSGYLTILSSEHQIESEEKQLRKILLDKVTVLTGQSGVGKSSLLNRLNPDFQIRTQGISKALGRGKHTTRHSELLPVAGGWVADTPGFSSLDFNHMSLEDLRAAIRDFAPFQKECRFRDCSHFDEPDCAVKAALQAGKLSSNRYNHYKEVAYLIKTRKEKY